MYTEDEAKTKWCPFARVITDEKLWPAANRHVLEMSDDVKTVGFEPARCIASECMAWRWARDEVMNNWHSTPDVPVPVPNAGWEVFGDVYETTKELPEQEQKAGTKQFYQRFRRRTGYCGLAGEPQ